MKLITKEILDAFKKQGYTGNKEAKDIKIIVKFFTPDGSASWFCYELEDDGDTLWCFANLGHDEFAELGTVSLKELQGVRGKLGLPVERDKYFGEHMLAEAINFKVR